MQVEKTNSPHEERNQDHVEPSQGEEIEDLVKEIKKEQNGRMSACQRGLLYLRYQ